MASKSYKWLKAAEANNRHHHFGDENLSVEARHWRAGIGISWHGAGVKRENIVANEAAAAKRSTRVSLIIEAPSSALKRKATYNVWREAGIRRHASVVPEIKAGGSKMLRRRPAIVAWRR